jgi:hypothetical protein
MLRSVRIADAGLAAALGLALGVGSVALLVLAVAVDLCFEGRHALRRLGPR